MLRSLISCPLQNVSTLQHHCIEKINRISTSDNIVQCQAHVEAIAHNVKTNSRELPEAEVREKLESLWLFNLHLLAKYVDKTVKGNEQRCCEDLVNWYILLMYHGNSGR